MKTIGLIGGMSWESTVTYYQVINRTVQSRLGGLHSAKCLLYSVDFAELEALMTSGQWDRIAGILAAAGACLEAAGAECIAVCTNTMHKTADAVQAAVSVPLLHIADLTAEALLQKGLRSAGLLGTRLTMEEDFYRSRLTARGIDVTVPDAASRRRLNDIIFDELCQGIILPESKDFLAGLAGSLHTGGAEAVILGCTELGLLLKQEETPFPLFDTAFIHAERTALFSLGTSA